MRRYFLRSAVSRASRRTVSFRKGKSAASLSRSKSGILKRASQQQLGQKPSTTSRRRPAKGSIWKCGTVLPCTCKCVTGAMTLLLFTGAVAMVILYFHKQRKAMIDHSSIMTVVREFMILQNESFKEKNDSEILDGVQHLAQNLSELKSRSEKVKNATDEIVKKFKDGWKPFSGHLYYYSITTQTAHAAGEACVREGAHLVDVKSLEEELYLENEAARRGGKYYIGLTYDGNRWKWVTGELLKDSYWGARAEGEEQGPCALIFGCGQPQQCWNFVRCDIPRKWICKLKLKAMDL